MGKRRKSPAKKKPPGILWLALVIFVCLAAMLFYFRKPKPEPLTTSQQRGMELAKIYCSSCHLFPEPELLDQKTWQNGALPLMEYWLGLKKPNMEKRRDGTLVELTNVYPDAPLLSTNDWEVIKSYYISAAPKVALPQQSKPKVEPALKHFRTSPLAYSRSTPMTTLVEIDSASQRLYIGDAITRTLEATDSVGHRIFAAEFDSSPISINIQPGVIDFLLVGRLFPSDDLKGRLLRLMPGAPGSPVTRLLANLRRPTDVKFADLNHDNRQDILVCQFGNLAGRLSWFENTGNSYLEHILHALPGFMRAEVRDFNKDGFLDIAALAGQNRDGVYLFTNDGKGSFTEKPIFQTHPLFGFTYFELADFNKDGHIDILAANGDNGEYDSPHKNYHGLRIFLNDGKNNFTEAWFFPMYGAYKAMAADCDLDGDLDIAAISYFPDYTKKPGESFVYLENTGNLNFKPFTTPDSTRGRWFTMDVGDLDSDGDPDIVLGSFLLGPTTIPIPPHLEADWKTNRKPLLLLENTIKD